MPLFVMDHREREKKSLALWDGDFYDFDFYVVRYWNVSN